MRYHDDEQLILSGIPANDKLKPLLNKSGKYLLVVTNFLSNRYSPFSVNFNEKWVEHIKKTANGNMVVIKQKTRLDDPNYKKNEQYLKDVYPEANVVTNTDDLNMLVSESYAVVGAYSTLMFKALQLRKPTFLIDGSGQVGNFANWKHHGTADKMAQSIYDQMTNTHSGDAEKFLLETLHGGIDFSAKKSYIKELKKLV